MNIEVFAGYLLAQDRANRTISGYKRDLEAFQAWYQQVNDNPPEAAGITPLDIRAYKKYLAETRQMKPASINRRLAALRAYFRWAGESGLVATNPTNRIRDVGQVNRAPRWLDRKQTFALLQAAASAIQLAEAKGLTPTAHLACRDAAIMAPAVKRRPARFRTLRPATGRCYPDRAEGAGRRSLGQGQQVSGSPP